MTQNEDERNYHIFYQLCVGANDRQRNTYGLADPTHFNYLNQSGCISIDGVDDYDEFGLVRSSSTNAQWSDDERV